MIPPTPLRVSRVLAGGSAVYVPPAGCVPLPLVYHPATSKSTFVSPAPLNTDTLPFAPTLATTMLGTVWPGPKLRFDAFGGAVPAGYTVR